MHEFSLLESVREILEQEAIKQQFTQVTKVTLEIGALSAVEPEAIRFGFGIVMQDSLAQDAELVIVDSPGAGVCQNCQQQVTVNALYEPCPRCGHFNVTIIHGAEMKIKELSVI